MGEPYARLQSSSSTIAVFADQYLLIPTEEQLLELAVSTMEVAIIRGSGRLCGIYSCGNVDNKLIAHEVDPAVAVIGTATAYFVTTFGSASADVYPM